ncbi:hypothetical protein QW131_19450 [Roseibium salinum]|nr:hypothetical protein [Roseibium salinum]
MSASALWAKALSGIPNAGSFFWFDILGKQLLTRENGTPRSWQFDEYVSAAGWVSKTELLIASSSKLFLFNLETEASKKTLRSGGGQTAEPLQ